MKISLIFGVIHMSFGVLLSVWNKVNHRHYHSIILEFFPQIIFLIFIFGYLIFMIFMKWVMYGANKEGAFSEHCAPNLLITFINMMLFKAAVRIYKYANIQKIYKYMKSHITLFRITTRT